MAENILKLKVDSTEYQGKVKRAVQGIREMQEACKNVGGTLAVVEKEELQFVQALGQMRTVAKDAKGKIAELNNAFVEASLVYKQLTDEEKASPFGKALSNSIDQLKTRLKDAKQSLADINSETSKSSNAFSALADKLGINVSSFMKFGTVAGAATAALKIAKDAFMSTEAGVDEWGRTVEAASSSYNAFCQTLATGNFDGFLKNLDNIISRAKETYNALDNLKTIGGIISNQEAMLNSKRAKDLKIIKDPNSTASQKAAAKADLKSIQTQKSAAIDQTKELNNDYIKKALRNQAGVLTDAEYKKYYSLIVRSLYDSAAKDALDQVVITHKGTRTTVNGQGISSTVATQSKINVGDLFTDKFRESINPYVQAYWNADTRKYTDERTDNRLMGNTHGGGSSSGGGSTSTTNSLDDAIAKSQRGFNNWQYEGEEVMRIMPVFKGGDTDILKEITQGGENPLAATEMAIGYTSPDADSSGSEKSWENYDFQKKVDKFNADNFIDAGKDAALAWQGAASAVGSVGQALQGIDDPMARVFGIVAEAIANVAGGLMSAFAKDKSTDSNLWAKIAAGVAATATMISMIASIHSATGYAKGGIVRAAGGAWVPGNMTSGDQVPAMLNSGELVLNKAQQGNLASQLEGGINSRMQLSATIKGEDIRLALNNNSRRRGKGEYVTSKAS